MKHIVLCMATWIVAASFVPPVLADVESASKRFEAIKALAGKWKGYRGSDKNDLMEVEFRVLSGGSAVAQIMMPGTKWEMLRVFSRDNDQLIATHYCLLGNQSRLRADKSEDKNNFKFSFYDGTNFVLKDELHLHHFTWKLNGNDGLVETFEMYDSGLKTDSATITLQRIK